MGGEHPGESQSAYTTGDHPRMGGEHDGLNILPTENWGRDGVLFQRDARLCSRKGPECPTYGTGWRPQPLGQLSTCGPVENGVSSRTCNCVLADHWGVSGLSTSGDVRPRFRNRAPARQTESNDRWRHVCLQVCDNYLRNTCSVGMQCHHRAT